LRRRGSSNGPLINQIDLIGGAETDEVAKTAMGATAFVSFTGSYTLGHFAELVAQPELRGRFLWIDSFCVDQFAWHRQKEQTEVIAFKKLFMFELANKIAEIGFTALFLDHWNDVMATLSQIWVVYELFATVDNDAELSVVFRDSERQTFKESVVDRANFHSIPHALASSLDSIDVEKAKAFKEEEKQAIFNVLQTNGNGFETVNHKQCDRPAAKVVSQGSSSLYK